MYSHHYWKHHIALLILLCKSKSNSNCLIQTWLQWIEPKPFKQFKIYRQSNKFSIYSAISHSNKRFTYMYIFLIHRSGKELTAGSVATFNVDHKSAKELRQYLANIAEQCENTGVGELPSVIILDNLHHVGSLGEVFNGFLSVKYQKW